MSRFRFIPRLSPMAVCRTGRVGLYGIRLPDATPASRSLTPPSVGAFRLNSVFIITFAPLAIHRSPLLLPGALAATLPAGRVLIR